MTQRWRALIGIVAGATLAVPGGAEQPSINITQTSLEELMNIDVTTVTKKPESLRATPAAVFVLTDEDIRRSGASSLPEALRLVPGVQVARANAHAWNVSIRGFHGSSNNKLLVVMDGRILYDPLHSGVFWEDQMIRMETVKRIEVIRGAGGALWGANAVNGIINIITKSAQETQGGQLGVGAGTEEREVVEASYGWKLDEATFLRASGNYQHRDAGFSAAPAFDDWQSARVGLRMDGTAGSQDRFMVDSRLRGIRLKERTVAGAIQEASHAGGHALVRWSRTWDPRTDLAVLAYYDNTQLYLDVFKEQRHTVNLDVQYHFRPAELHDVVGGVGYRRTMDAASSSGILFLVPPERSDNLYTAFLQDDITVVPDRLNFILGSKIEQNAYTGVEFQPNVRWAWRPDPHQTVWGAVSRIVRVPSRLETDVRVYFPPTIALTGSALLAERVVSYEAGFRTQLGDDLAFDVAAFYSVYDNLVTAETSTLANYLKGRTWGLEWSGIWRVDPTWRLTAGYTFFMMDLDLAASSVAGAAVARTQNGDPRHQAFARSSMDLPHQVEWDATLRYVDALISLGVPSYVAIDMRVGWQPTASWEFSIAGQNLFTGRHQEAATSATATEVESGVAVKATWKF